MLMETTHVVTSGDTRRIASVVVLHNGGTAHGSQCRDLVAQLSKVLQSVKIAPAVIPAGRITPNRAGDAFACCTAAFDDMARRCALFVGMANGTVSICAAVDLMFDDEIQLTATETAELIAMWRNSAAVETVREWAHEHALLALAQYATEYVAAGMLELRADCLRMLADCRAYTAPSATISAALALLAAVLQRLAALSFPDTGAPPDTAPVVSLLIVSAALLPRAPQSARSSGSVPIPTGAV
ncbi:hypothetical protein [Bifidobacterium leontopitheci]|uniref:hypothetical protein n=1 Tax=Bifidobacterium leontopitheci TaxID=2650774 RepID=UPI00186B01BC|nr:hypothetical protein [Bifidobacterium leontopitheci]